MVKGRELIAWAGVLVLLFLLVRKDVEIVEVTLPVRRNTKVITTPQPINEGKKEVVLTNFESIKINNPLNDTLVKAYLAQKDSLSRLNNFIDATRQRDYVELLDDSLQIITVETRVNGFMREQVIKYETKEQKIQVPIKTRKGLYAGGSLIMPTQVGQSPTLGGMINIVDKKRVFTLGYDLQGTLQAGVTFKLF